jgi:hypothetical protein
MNSFVIVRVLHEIKMYAVYNNMQEDYFLTRFVIFIERVPMGLEGEEKATLTLNSIEYSKICIMANNATL